MNCIIVDDEYPAREELKYFIKTYSDLDIKEEFDDSLDVLKYLEKNYVDVIFLDINMPNLDGMNLARIIAKFKHSPKIVFISAYKEYAIEAFEVRAFDYILKPYPEEKIIDTLKKIKESFKDKQEGVQKITLWKNEKMFVLNVNDICYCRANERVTMIYTDKDEYVVNSSISEFQCKIKSTDFFKTHRSYIVNINKIKEIIPWFNNTYNIKFDGIEDEIPVSRTHIKEFKKIMRI